MKNKKKISKMLLTVFLLLITILVCSCNLDNKTIDKVDDKKKETKTKKTKDKFKNIDIEEIKDIDEMGINENKDVYAEDDASSLVYFYVTVRKGTKGSDTAHTLKEVENVLKYKNNEPVYSEEVKADAIIQIGDEEGPKGSLFGNNVTETNGTISKRGNSSSQANQSSFKLELDKEAGLWRGQRNIALNKHAFDNSRIRNKLYFDLLKDIKDVPSLRTQFVKLYIKDETSGKKKFSDYGIFTQVEVPNKKYLLNHGFDNSGYLYKIRSFNFENNDVIRNFDDPKYNEEEFQKIMDCKGKKDNNRIIEMIDKINNYEYEINDIIDKYFDRDNYITWLAYNILVGNTDTTMQNFYLYSPLNGNKWYFIPWDGDGAFDINEGIMLEDEDRTKTWNKGITNYWGIELHKRFLKVDSNRIQLKEKVEELKKILTVDKISSLINVYSNTVDKHILKMPDLLNMGVTVEERNKILRDLPSEIELNYNAFLDSLEEVMPFYLRVPQITDNEIIFTWDDAYDFKNKGIKYDLIISATADMSKEVARVNDIRGLNVKIKKLKKGKYYYTVKAKADDGRISKPFQITRVSDEKYYGVETLVIK